jgi:hypothetical protein
MGFEFNLMEKDSEKSYLELIEDYDNYEWTGDDPDEIILNEK